MAAIGISVPGASALMSGGSLADQTADETEEQRRRRLLAQQQRQLLPNAGVTSLGLSPTGYSAALGR